MPADIYWQGTSIQMKKIKILFVCTANICRSPMAQGIFQWLVEAEGLRKRIKVDSAGTHVSQAGVRPDRRAQQVALAHGVDISGIRTRGIRKGDFSSYDYIVAMDQGNMRALEQQLPEVPCCDLSLMTDFAPGLGLDEVPDPYYGNLAGFERVFQILDMAARGVLDRIRDDLV